MIGTGSMTDPYILLEMNNANLMHLFHKKCERYGIIRNNEQIFNYLRTFDDVD